MSRTQGFTLCRIAAVFLTIGLIATALPAQDLRTVKEPVIPPACVTLKAAMTTASATGGDIEARSFKAGVAQEGLDTTRLQQALDHCGKGNAVELALDGSNNAFLTGPIALRPGVTLLVDKGVTLYGTRNPGILCPLPGELRSR